MSDRFRCEAHREFDLPLCPVCMLEARDKVVDSFKEHINRLELGLATLTAKLEAVEAILAQAQGAHEAELHLAIHDALAKLRGSEGMR